jgi:hypothetical protein
VKLAVEISASGTTDVMKPSPPLIELAEVDSPFRHPAESILLLDASLLIDPV